MNKPTVSLSLITLCLALAPVLLPGQAVPPADATLRRLPANDPDSAHPTAPAYELTVKWNERSTTVLSVPFKNESDKTLKVLGVQATRGIFIGDYPNTVSSKKEESIAFVYDAADNTDGDTDLIRVLTDQGIKDILVKIVREEAVKLDTRELTWTVGDAVEPKSVTITVNAGTVMPLRVRTLNGHHALLETAGANTWRVKITPASTSKSGKFAVFVDFDQPLPGKAAVILGVIQPKE